MNFTPEEAFIHLYKWLNKKDGTPPDRVAVMTLMCDYRKLRASEIDNALIEANLEKPKDY